MNQVAEVPITSLPCHDKYRRFEKETKRTLIETQLKMSGKEKCPDERYDVRSLE